MGELHSKIPFVVSLSNHERPFPLEASSSQWYVI